MWNDVYKLRYLSIYLSINLPMIYRHMNGPMTGWWLGVRLPWWLESSILRLAPVSLALFWFLIIQLYLAVVFGDFFFSEEHVSHRKFKDFPNAIHIEAYAKARDNKRQTCVYNYIYIYISYVYIFYIFVYYHIFIAYLNTYIYIYRHILIDQPGFVESIGLVFSQRGSRLRLRRHSL